MIKKYSVGVDIGGSHISATLVDIQTGAMLAESKSEWKVNNQATAEEIFNDWSIAIKQTMGYADTDDIVGIGFAMPGPFDYKTGVALLENVGKYESLYGINVGDELKKILNLPATMPFRYLNDALSFAVGECWVGKASGYENVVAITLGTGFGSAFLTNGVPVVDGDRAPEKGYVYHILYKAGIADDYFSTRGLINEFEQISGKKCKGVKEIADRSETEPQAKLLFEDFGRNIGNFLSPLLLKFRAGCLVIGGNISGAYHLFGPSLESAFQKNNIDVEVVISEMMESAAMVGSSRLLEDQFWTKIKPILSKI